MASLPCGHAYFEKANRTSLFGIPLSLICCVTSEKPFNLSEPQSIKYKIGIVLPTSQSPCEADRKQVSDTGS